MCQRGKCSPAKYLFGVTDDRDVAVLERVRARLAEEHPRLTQHLCIERGGLYIHREPGCTPLMHE